jgi:hypothetical protein
VQGLLFSVQILLLKCGNEGCTADQWQDFPNANRVVLESISTDGCILPAGYVVPERSPIGSCIIEPVVFIKRQHHPRSAT